MFRTSTQFHCYFSPRFGRRTFAGYTLGVKSWPKQICFVLTKASQSTLISYRKAEVLFGKRFGNSLCPVFSFLHFSLFQSPFVMSQFALYVGYQRSRDQFEPHTFRLAFYALCCDRGELQFHLYVKSSLWLPRKAFP